MSHKKNTTQKTLHHIGVPNHFNPAPVLGMLETSIVQCSPQQIVAMDQYIPHFTAKDINPNTKTVAEYKALTNLSVGARWQLGMCKEQGRLLQGFTSHQLKQIVQGTNTFTT
jgi:hypothetical protein